MYNIIVRQDPKDGWYWEVSSAVGVWPNPSDSWSMQTVSVFNTAKTADKAMIAAAKLVAGNVQRRLIDDLRDSYIAGAIVAKAKI